MNLARTMAFGRYYVVFARGRQFRGRVIRLDAALVELVHAGGVTRLGAREIRAVLEPPMLDQDRIVA